MKIGIKVIEWNPGMPVISAIEVVGAETRATELFYEFDDVNTADSVAAKSGGAAMWVKTFLVPKINAWLATRFPASGTTPPPTPPGTTIEDFDAAIFAGLKWLPQPDGTIKVSA